MGMGNGIQNMVFLRYENRENERWNFKFVRLRERTFFFIKNREEKIQKKAKEKRKGSLFVYNMYKYIVQLSKGVFV